MRGESTQRVVRLDALVVLKIAGHIIGDAVAAAGHGGRVITGRARIEERRAARRFLFDAIPRNDRARGVLEIVGLDSVARIGKIKRARFDLEIPVRLARRSALFGDDLDDAVGGFGSIDGRRRRTLDDFDALDVFGVNVVETPTDGATLRREPARAHAKAGRAVHANTVHVKQRGVVERQTRAPTNLNGLRGAEARRAGRHHHTRRARREEVTEARRDRLPEGV